MQDQIRPQLPILAIIQASYRDFFTRIRSHVILSYLISLPFFLANMLGWVTMPNFQAANPENFFTLELAIYMIASLMLFTLLIILYFRLYTLGRENFLKVSFSGLAEIYGRMLIYSLMAAGLLFITIICLTLVTGLIAGILTNILAFGGQAQLLTNYMAIMVTLIMTFVISLRLQPTFISIAQGLPPMPFKTSWYHTRGHSRDILIISVGAILLPYI